MKKQQQPESLQSPDVRHLAQGHSYQRPIATLVPLKVEERLLACTKVGSLPVEPGCLKALSSS